MTTWVIQYYIKDLYDYKTEQIELSTNIRDEAIQQARQLLNQGQELVNIKRLYEKTVIFNGIEKTVYYTI